MASDIDPNQTLALDHKDIPTRSFHSQGISDGLSRLSRYTFEDD